MQVQPRGKKRGAKESVAGGKKTKKEEEPKPFVCAIYRRDIASFLPRAKIQQWRLTSSNSNASLIEFPTLLPRFKYSRLAVIFASTDRCVVKKGGFLHFLSDGCSMDGTEFASIYKFRFCCRDDSASKIVGKRLFPNKPDNEGVAFQLETKTDAREVVCRVPNLLTKKTAPAMLHFLHHLSQACYKRVEMVPGVTADAAECELNPLVLQTIPNFRLRGVMFGPALRIRSKLSNLTVEVASRMRIRFDLLCYHRYNFLGQELTQLLNFIANGRRLDKRLVLQAYIHSADVDQIVKYFEEDVRSLEGAIRDVRGTNLRIRLPVDYGWPVRCLKEEATQVTERDGGTVEHRFDYNNTHSKEPFSLLLVTRLHDGLICKFHLMFDSAQIERRGLGAGS